MNTNEIINGFKSDWLGKSSSYIGKPSKLQGLIEDVEPLLGQSGLADVLDDLISIIDYVKDIANGSYKEYSGTKLALAVAAIIYVVSPLDIIPDAIPLLGFTDDAAVVAWAISQLRSELQKYRYWKF